MFRLTNAPALTAAFVLMSILAAQADVAGVVRIIDGDTVEVANVRIRLEGIDAPETDQLCLNESGAIWTCGIAARDALVAYAGSKIWNCRLGGTDRYRRSLGTCEVDGENVNAWLVLNGWALSFTRYSHAYDADQESARQGLAGLWRGAFIAPWNWRRRGPRTEILGAYSIPVNAQEKLLAISPGEAPLPQCAIKANYSRRGECIYHLPGGHFYGSMRMEPNGRKRWFCSELEAIAAGCRRSKL